MRRLLFVVAEDWSFMSHRLPMAKAARAAGFEVHVACKVDQHGDAIRAQGFHMHPMHWERCKIGPIALGAEVAQLIQLVQQIEPILLHCVGLKPIMLGGLARQVVKIPHIIYAFVGLGYAFGHSWQAQTIRLALVPILKLFCCQNGAYVLLQNKDDQHELEKRGVIKRGAATLIRGSGVELDYFAALPMPNGPLTLGYTGRMLRHKGAHLMVAAQQILREQGHDINLILAGESDPANPSSITDAELQTWAKLPGVEWLGKISDVRQVWQRAHIAVLLSRSEGVPKSLLEAASCSRPVLTTDAPGCRDVVQPGQTGWRVGLDNHAQLIAALKTMITTPLEILTAMGQQSRAFVANTFSAEQVAREIGEFYTRITQ